MRNEAAKLMKLEPTAEQVGFLGCSGPGYELSLQMTGGEFCGNAALSAAAVFCMNAGKRNNKAETVRVLVSGAADPVPIEIRQIGSNAYKGTVSMPVPLDITSVDFRYGEEDFSFPVIRFEGITHLLSFQPLQREAAETIVKNQCTRLQADALGIMQIDTDTGTLLPLVYVPKSGTLFWEGSCASGTAAAGSFLHSHTGAGKWEFTEPAGRLIIESSPDGRLLLTGNVSIKEKEYLS
ncbi:MAG: hypothetical protein J6W65_06380 [Oscillospiraceae bacterium]|nr:hypothetical protein [Oscillospiraceae bacterium]